MTDDLDAELAELAEPRPLAAVVVTQAAVAAPLAAACALSGVVADIAPSPIGALVVPRDPTHGPDTAAALSQLLRGSTVLLLVRFADRVDATRWESGAQAEELASGLVLAEAPVVLEDLLLGTVAIGELDDVVTSTGMSRWQAARTLGSAARGARRRR